MATKRAKLQVKTEPEDFNEGNTIGVDRISALPDSLIHHILSLVPTIDVVRMSLLSRRWRRMWCSVPVVCFCESRDVGELILDRIRFRRFVQKYLDQRRNDMLNVTDMSVTSFKLDIKFYPFDTRIIDLWLNSVARFSKVKELELCIRTKAPRKLYYLQPDVFSSNSFTIVRLCGMTLRSLNSFTLPSLISLSLENVRLDDQVLHTLLTGCYSVEKLLIKECMNLSNPTISNLSLKFLEIVHGNRQTTFEVEAMNLESFAYNGGTFYCDLNLPSCETLRYISLSNLKFEDEWLEDLISELPLLESLSLCNCKFSYIDIWSEHLKHFVFRGNKSCHLLEAKIHAPNLVSFSFEGFLLSNFSMIATNMLQANIKLHNPRTHGMQWYFNLLDFLINLDCSKSLNLHIYSEEVYLNTLIFFYHCFHLLYCIHSSFHLFACKLTFLSFLILTLFVVLICIGSNLTK